MRGSCCNQIPSLVFANIGALMAEEGDVSLHEEVGEVVGAGPGAVGDAGTTGVGAVGGDFLRQKRPKVKNLNNGRQTNGVLAVA